MDNLKYIVQKYESVDKFLAVQPNLEKLFKYVSESMTNLKTFMSVYDEMITETVGKEQYDIGYDDAEINCKQNDDDVEEIKEESFQEGYDEGYNEGYEEGAEAGLVDGEEIGREKGYSEGHTKGFEAGLAEAARIAKLSQP